MYWAVNKLGVLVHISRMRQTLRGRNAVAHVFELWIGLAGIIAGIVFAYQPASISTDAVAAATGRDIAAIWVCAYALAGVAIWWGLLHPSIRWEAVGLWLLGTATAVEGVAVIDLFGWHGAATASLLFALTVASWLRAITVQVDARALVTASESTDAAA